MTQPATVATTGSGWASAAPDAMRLRVAARTTAGSVSQALAGVAAAADRLSEVARGFVVEERIASRDLNVWPHHTDSGGAAFQANHSFEVYCDSLERSGELVTALGAALPDALVVDSVEPVLSDTSGLARRARELAFGDARAKADELAVLAGGVLGQVVSIVEEGGHAQPFELTTLDRAGGATRFEPGLSSVTAIVRVTWQLITT